MLAHPAGALHADQRHTSYGEPIPPDSLTLHALDPAVWPINAARTSDGGISIAGCHLSDLAQEYATPLFVCDERDFQQRCRTFISATQTAAADHDMKLRVYYAGKAFLCADVVRWVQQEGLGLDVCSLGELQLALHCGFDPTRIIMHGNNKSREFLAAGVQAGVEQIVLDSWSEIDLLEQVVADLGRQAAVLIRVTVGVEAQTRHDIATVNEDQKFGFSLAAGMATEAIARVLANPALSLIGLHTHIGSQIFDPSAYDLAAHRMVGLLMTVRDEFGVTLRELDMGGGFGIAYTSGEQPQTPVFLVSTLLRTISQECSAAGLPMPVVTVEPGRCLIGPSMVTVYRVGTVKTVSLDDGGQHISISVDGGMSDNIRPALYGAVHSVTLANRMSSAMPCTARVVGHHGEPGDVVVNHAWLPDDIAAGDLLAVASTGAYCYAMSSNFTMVPRPAMVKVREGRAELMLRRQHWEDLVALDCGLSTLQEQWGGIVS